MKRALATITVLAVPSIATLAASAANAAVGSLIPAHSHWDVRNANHELKICYTIIGSSAGAGQTIAFLPVREQDAKNFMQLGITKTGFELKRRVAGTFTTITPIVATPQPHGTPGQEIMFDYVEQGSDFYVYTLNSDLTRGPLLYHWRDATYPVGVNISYYTQPHWAGKWDFVHGHPLDTVGMPHEISNLTQDARNHPSVTGAATFDDPTPASGGITDITNRDVATVYAGLASSTDYTYTFDVTGPGSGHVDYRDPGDASNEIYFAHSFYRLTVGSTSATVQRFNGTTAGTTWHAAQSGPGSYRLVLRGSDQALYKGTTQVLHVNDGGPTTGLRVRFVPGSQTWSFTGTVDP